MAELIQYAQMATRVYKTSFDRNRIDPPAGWIELDWQPDRFTGFSAGAYQRGSEIVIAYTGTNDRIADPLNWTAGMGLPVPQIFEAVDYYLAIKAAHPEATNITFTGHSLGGGLASLMAVFFDKQATTFDEAPFQQAAYSPLVLASVASMMSARGNWDSAFTSYLASGGLLALSREYNIRHYSIQGEVLSPIRLPMYTLIGSDHVLAKGESTAGVVDLHSMSLLTAALESPNFHEVMQKLPSLVSQVFDPNLFFADPQNETKKDLLRHLLRHQFGADGVTANAMLDRFGADFAKLTYDAGGSKASELMQAIIAVGLQHYYQQDTSTENFFQRLSGGIRFDLTKPLGDTDTALGSILGYEKLLEAARPMAPWETAGGYPQPWEALNEFTANKVRWNVALGTVGLQDSATGATADLVLGGTGNDNFTAGEGDDLLIGGAGADVLLGEDGNDILYGGGDQDTLLGNAGDDKLYGGAGLDLLDGGAGNDILAGGEGRDIYRLVEQGGKDRIEDDDGILMWGSQIVAGVFRQEGTSQTYRHAQDANIMLDFGGGAATLKFADGTQAVLARQATPDAFDGAPFGIKLQMKPAAAPSGGREIKGDIELTRYSITYDSSTWIGPKWGYSFAWYWSAPEWIMQRDFAGTGSVAYDQYHLVGTILPTHTRSYSIGEDTITYHLFDDLGNTIGTPVDPAWVAAGSQYEDELFGSDGNDTILALTGGDYIWAGGGNDVIVGGTDWAWPGYQDCLSGEAGDDVIYADNEIDLSALPSLNNFGGSANDDRFGDILHGGAGNDQAVGTARHDIIFGGAGKDLLVGAAGDDVICGDQDLKPGDFVEYYFDRASGFTTYFVADTRDTKDTTAGPWYNRNIGSGKFFYSASGRWVDRGTEAVVGGDADIIYGGAGDDRIHGQVGNDILYGENGKDVITGDDGNDTIYGGSEDDRLTGDSGGRDESATGNDFIDGGAGQDWIQGEGGDDILLGSAGNDEMYGDASSGDGSRYGNDVLDGGDGDDTIKGQGGNDILIGGAGSDTLIGGSGKDIYIFNKGDGVDKIIDDSTGAEKSVLIFGKGISSSDVKLGLGSLLLDLGGGDAIHIEDFDPYAPFAAPGFELFQFADGGNLTWEEMLSKGFDLIGTDDDEVLEGTALDDRIFGLSGNDDLWGMAGNDTLQGGAGDDALLGEDGDDVMNGNGDDDYLDGGYGSDRYVYELDGGVDTITDEGSDWQGYLAWYYANLGIVDQQDLDLRMQYGGQWFWQDASGEGGNETVVAESLEGLRNNLTESHPWVIEQFDQMVEDGEIRYLDPLPEPPPEIAGNDHAALEGLYATGAIALDRVVFGEGIALEDLVLSGDEENGLRMRTAEGGGVDVMLANKWDTMGMGVELFEFTDGRVVTMREMLERAGIAGANHEPAVDASLANQTATEDEAFSFIVPADAFMDEDENDSLSYSATLADGSPLPDWLAFDAVTGTFAGTPGNDDVGTLAVTVTATDLAGASATTSFDLAVENVNDAPTAGAALPDVLLNEDEPAEVALPTGAFTDVDAGDTLTYGATLADGSPLPSWLVVDPWTGTLHGQPANDDVGVYRVHITASDNAGVSAAGEFDLTVANVNDAPILVEPLADQTMRPGDAFAWSLPSGAFADVDAGDRLSYSASLSDGNPLPSWLAFDPATGAFAGKAPRNAKGGLDIRVTASDGHGADSTASDVFRLDFDRKGGCHGNEGLGNGEDPPPPGHDHNWNDGPGTRPGHPGARDGGPRHEGRNPLDALAEFFAQGRLDAAAVARALTLFDDAAEERRRGEDRAWRDGDGCARGHGHATHAAWTRMNERLDRHLFGGNGGLLGGELPGFHGRDDDLERLVAGASRNVLSGSRHLMGVQSFQSFNGLHEGVARLG